MHHVDPRTEYCSRTNSAFLFERNLQFALSGCGRLSSCLSALLWFCIIFHHSLSISKARACFESDVNAFCVDDQSQNIE